MWLWQPHFPCEEWPEPRPEDSLVCLTTASFSASASPPSASASPPSPPVASPLVAVVSPPSASASPPTETATALPFPIWVLPVFASPPSPPVALASPPVALGSPWTTLLLLLCPGVVGVGSGTEAAEDAAPIAMATTAAITAVRYRIGEFLSCLSLLFAGGVHGLPAQPWGLVQEDLARALKRADEWGGRAELRRLPGPAQSRRRH